MLGSFICVVGSGSGVHSILWWLFSLPPLALRTIPPKPLQAQPDSWPPSPHSIHLTMALQVMVAIVAFVWL